VAELNRAPACRSVVEPRTLVRTAVDSQPLTGQRGSWLRRSRKFEPPNGGDEDVTGEGGLMKFWQNNRLDGTFEGVDRADRGPVSGVDLVDPPTSTSIPLCAAS